MAKSQAIKQAIIQAIVEASHATVMAITIINEGNRRPVRGGRQFSTGGVMRAKLGDPH